MNKQPEMTAKTRQTIIDAFWELALQKGIAGVTISAISKRAGCNRSTVYAYFSDIPDLLNQVEEELIEDLRKRMGMPVMDTCIMDLEGISGRVVEVFAEYDEKLFLLIGKQGDPAFRQIVQAEATKQLQAVLSCAEFADNGEYVMAYITSALFGLLTFWHDSGRRIDAGQLSRMICTLATRGIGGLIRQE